MPLNCVDPVKPDACIRIELIGALAAPGTFLREPTRDTRHYEPKQHGEKLVRTSVLAPQYYGLL